MQNKCHGLLIPMVMVKMFSHHHNCFLFQSHFAESDNTNLPQLTGDLDMQPVSWFNMDGEMKQGPQLLDLKELLCFQNAIIQNLLLCSLLESLAVNPSTLEVEIERQKH